jgi:4-aminobutyrate aminotransferase-like enzyme
LAQRSQILGQYLLESLQTAFGKHPLVTDIRSKGLMIGMELTSNEITDAPTITDMVLENMKDSGFLLGKTGPGRNVLTFMPPLIVEKQQIHQVIDELEKVLDVIQ